MKVPKIKKGVYQHYKNKKTYDVLGVALHTETEEFLVVYKPKYKSEFSLFARPYKMFLEKTKDPETNRLVPRFKYIRSE